MALPELLVPDGTPAFLSAEQSIELTPMFADTQMRTGHDRKRRLYTTVPRVVSVALFLTPAQVLAFHNWFEGPLLAGAAQFTACVAKQGLGKLYWAARFLEPYIAEPTPGARLWHVSAKLLLTGSPSATAPYTPNMSAATAVALVGAGTTTAPMNLASATTVLMLGFTRIASASSILLLPAAPPLAPVFILSGNRASTQMVQRPQTWPYAAVARRPTAMLPPPGFSSRSLLVHFNNAGGNPIDSSSHGFSTASSTVDISAAQLVFGAAAGHFDGSTTWASWADNAAFDLTTGDFSLEFWLRLHSLASNQQILSKQAGTGNYPWQVYFDSSLGKLGFRGLDSFSVGAYNITGSTTIVVDTWYFVRAGRNGSTFDIALNGVSDGSFVSTAIALYSNAGDAVVLGSSASHTVVLNGYIDDLRITKGYFETAVPSAQFPDS